MKIRTRILWTLFGMSMLVALVGALAVNRQRAAALAGATREAENVARVLGFVLMSNSNQLDSSAQEIVTRLHEAQRRDVVLVDAHERILADAVPASVGKVFAEDSGHEVAVTLRDGRLRTFVEISKDHPNGIKQIVAPVKTKSGQTLGAVILEYTPLYNEWMQATKRTTRQVMLATLGSLTLALAIAFYIGRSIARPLKQLTNAATGFASGRTDLPMPPPRKNEIGQLATAFSSMMQTRQLAEDELRCLRDQLEVRVTERTADLAETNKSLQALRRRYELILQSVVEGIHGIGLDGTIIFENATAARLLGREAEDLIGRPAHETIHHSRRDGSAYPKEECPIYQTLRDGVVRHSGEESFWRPDGSSFPVDYVSAPLRDERGEIAGVVVTFRDTTERKETEEALRRQEEQYRILFQTHPNPTWVYDAETLAYLAVNDAAVEHYGYSREEFLEMTIREIRPQEDVPALIEASNVSAVKEKGEQSRHSGIWRHRKKSGEILFADIYTTNIQFEGRAAHLVIAIDVTEKKKAEDAIRDSEERMRAVLESALDCVITMDHQGKVIEFNPAAEKTFGYKRNEAVGQLLADLIIPPSLRERHTRGLTHYLSTGEAAVLGERIELTGMRRDRSEFPVELAITRIGSQEPPMFTGFIRDITRRKQAEEALKEAEEKYRGIFENAVEGIFQTTTDGRFISANFALARLLGFDSPEELIAARTDIARENYVDPKSREEFKRLLDENGSVLDFELEAFRRDGSRIWLSENVLAVRNDKGTVLHYEGTAQDITERKRAERALRASEERYRSLFESNPNPMWVYDVETLSFLAVNSAAVEHYGYSQDEFLAMTIKDIRPTEDIPALMDELSKTDRTNDSTQWRHFTKDRVMIVVETTSHDLTWLGRLARLVLINDITERKDAEGRYRGLLEAAPDAMVVVNQGGEIVLLNLQAEKQFGYRRDELVGQKVKNIIPDGFAERLVADDLRSAEDALAQQIGTGIELTGRRKNGSDFPIEIMLSPLESADGILVTAAIRDITERKRAEDRLRQQARLLDLAHDAIMVRDMEDRVEFWNHGAEELYGWTAAEVQGRKASTFLYQDEPASTAAARAGVIENGKWTGECKHKCKDGGTTTVRSRWTLVRDQLAAPKSILIINTDVTEQRKLETHLLRAQRLESIGTLASGVAHDLNNILTPILICTEVLKGNPTREDLPGLVSMIEESARRGANVVKQVLTFARGIEGERVVIKPSHLIQEMIDIAQKTFPKTIEILSRYPSNLWSIKGDPTQLHQVLLNLSVNARDAMLNGGSLTLAAENFNVDENYASMMPGAKPGPHVMLRVTDTGRGMPRAMIDKIFDPFFTSKEVGKGTGLGLSTTLGIVKSHGGFISVYSEPGKGTTFKVFLPAAAIQEELAQSKTSIVPVQGNGELILVVDDEPNILGVTKMILEKYRYDVVSANDGPEALAIFAQQMKSISLVLTDLSMPYLDGIALVRSLKKMRPDLSIVASTGQGERADVAELQSLGVKNFLSKPYNTERLLATLDDALHGRESESPGVQTT